MLGSITVQVSAPLNSSNSNQTQLFQLTVPPLRKTETSSGLSVKSNVSVSNIYAMAYWLNEVISDVTGKWVTAQPVFVGSLWSLICEPVRLNISVLDAIDADGSLRSNKTRQGRRDDIYSKIFFSMKVRDADSLVPRRRGIDSRRV
jgi:hypothetical protein